MATFVTSIPTHLLNLAGASFIDSELYVSDLFDVDFNLSGAIVDKTTGAFTPFSDQGGSLNWQGLASDEANDLLYTVDINDGAKLKSVTPAGLITTISPGVGFNVSGLAYDDANGILYAIGSGVFMTIDTTTGIATQIGDFGVQIGVWRTTKSPIFFMPTKASTRRACIQSTSRRAWRHSWGLISWAIRSTVWPGSRRTQSQTL